MEVTIEEIIRESEKCFKKDSTPRSLNSHVVALTIDNQLIILPIAPPLIK